jgi:hypothetical protein
MRAHTKGKDKMGRRFAIVIGLAAAGVMAFGAQTAVAGVVKYDTKLSGHGEANRIYHGEVKSKVRKCERKRLVVLFQVRPGADRKVGTDRSDRDGSWLVERRGGGRFYAKVRRKQHIVSGNGYVCRADRSCVSRRPCQTTARSRARQHGAFLSRRGPSPSWGSEANRL